MVYEAREGTASGQWGKKQREKGIVKKKQSRHKSEDGRLQEKRKKLCGEQ